MNVYCLYFPNGKRYIGVETKTGSRIGAHRRMDTLKPTYKSAPQLVDKAVAKYKWENVKWRYLAANCSQQDGWNLEKTFIKLLNTQDLDFGYNISEGGGKYALGSKRTPEFCRLQSEKAKKRGTSHMNTPEVIAKRLQSKRLNPPPKQTAWNKGKKLSEEHCKKLRLGQNLRDPSTRKGPPKGSVSWNKGIKMKEESKIKMIESKSRLIALPSGSNGEIRYFRPEQLI